MNATTRLDLLSNAFVMRDLDDALRTSAYARMMLTTKVRHLDLRESAGL